MIKVGKRTIKNKNSHALLLRTGGQYFKVLERDNYKCTKCGDDDYIVVHHKDRDVENNVISNLITVCKRCHAELHGQTLKMSAPTANMIVELKKQGQTYQQIGDYLGISRQRVHQILKNAIERFGLGDVSAINPKINKEDLLTKHMVIRIEDLDFEFIRNEAKKRGISMSRYLRELIKKEQAK